MIVHESLRMGSGNRLVESEHVSGILLLRLVLLLRSSCSSFLLSGFDCSYKYT